MTYTKKQLAFLKKFIDFDLDGEEEIAILYFNDTSASLSLKEYHRQHKLNTKYHKENNENVSPQLKAKVKN